MIGDQLTKEQSEAFYEKCVAREALALAGQVYRDNPTPETSRALDEARARVEAAEYYWREAYPDYMRDIIDSAG